MKNSVIMATYNGERFIVKQLDSIKNQTLPPDEVIICDDCSTDNTAKIIENYIKENGLIGWKLTINKENVGFYDNFFSGLRKCTGDIIYLSDQDDIWDVNKIEIFTKQYDENPQIMMIQSRFKYIDENGTELRKQEDYHYFTSGHNCDLSIWDMCKFAGSGFTMSFRKIISNKVFWLKLNKRKDIFVFHDIILGLMSISEGQCILNRDVLDKHRIHSDNVTKKKDKSYIAGRTKENQVNILKKRTEYFRVLAKNTNDKNKRNVFISFSQFAKTRYEYIEKFSIKKIISLVKKRKMYASKFGIVTDSLYSLGLQKVVIFVTK